MMKNLLFELKKSVLTKGSLFIIIALLLLNTILSLNYSKEASNSERTYNYEHVITTIISNSQKQLEQISIDDPDSYAAKYLGKVESIYSELKGLKIKTLDQNITGWDTYLKFNAANPILLICIIFISIRIFSIDITTGFLPIIYATTNGRSKYILIKILETVFVSVILNILFAFFSYLGMSQSCSFSGFNELIQNFDIFKAAPYPLLVWQALLLLLCLRTVVTISIAVFVGAIVYLTKSRLLPLISTVLIYSVNLVLNNLIYLNNDSIFEQCNMVAAMDITTVLTKYQCVRLFGEPLSVVPVIIVLYFIIFFVFSIVIFALHNHFIYFKVKIHLRIRNRKQKVKSKRKTLFGWELTKIFHNRVVVLLIVLLILIAAVISVIQYLDITSSSDKIFYDYIQQLKPMSINEREAFIINEKTRISNAYDEYAAYQNAMINRSDYDGDIEKLESEYYYALLHEVPLQRLSAMHKYIAKNENKEDLSLIYDTGWMRLFESGQSLPLFLLIVLLATFLVSIESSSKFSAILNTTPLGRSNTQNSKLFVCITLTTVFFIIFTLLQSIPILIGYNFEDMTAKLTSLEVYQNASPNLQLWQYFVLIIIIRYITYILISVLSYQIARRIKIAYLSMIIVIIFVQLPALAYGMGIDILKYLMLSAFLDGNEFLLLGMNVGWIKSSLVFIVFLTIIISISIINHRRSRRGIYGS